VLVSPLRHDSASTMFACLVRLGRQELRCDFIWFRACQSLDGFPSSAIVGFAVDPKGRPIFSFSSISSHKQVIASSSMIWCRIQSRQYLGFAVDPKGRPIFAFSSISSHKQVIVSQCLRRYPLVV
jgi:hypothetical protein